MEGVAENAFMGKFAEAFDHLFIDRGLDEGASSGNTALTSVAHHLLKCNLRSLVH